MYSPASPEAETAAWFRLRARGPLLAGLAALALLLVFLLGVGSDSSVLREYAELVQASRQPAAYRVAMVFDALGWLLIGGLLLTFAGLAGRHAPVRAAVLVAYAIWQLAGAPSGFMRRFR